MKLYPKKKPFDTGYLSVGDGHTIYYEQAGNPEGQTVVYLHGGPGAGCSFNESRYFNSDYYHIIMFDQRGAGKSRPYASVENNTIAILIDDLEKLRQHLDIKNWYVVGGSWGSTFALLYSREHTERVGRLLVRGVFFGDNKGVANIVEDGGANLLRSDYFAQYRNLIPVEDRENGLLQPYYNLLVNGSDQERVEAAKHFHLWDTSIATYKINESWLSGIVAEPEKSLSISRLFFHFAKHEFKPENRNTILTPNDKLKQIPLDIVHGENDLICPVENARVLKRAYPDSKLHVVLYTGHAMAETGIENKFLEITKRWIEEAR